MVNAEGSLVLICTGLTIKVQVDYLLCIINVYLCNDGLCFN